MKRKKALKNISEKLKEGKTKPEIYKELSSKVKFKSDLTHGGIHLTQVPTICCGCVF
jgi:hypothetical protein